MTAPLLRRRSSHEIRIRRGSAVDEATELEAESIVRDVERRGEAALREYAHQFGDLQPGDPLIVRPTELQRALEEIDREDRETLERTAERIRSFAAAQRASLSDVRVEIPGGVASHRVMPLDAAACYAPGGRYPLPSSLLMTTMTAREAGVGDVWAASPRPGTLMKATASIAGVDGLVAAGGAQAIAAFAFGVGDIPACDVIVGPGNRWVTATKKLVSGRVRIDMLAGPSELVIVADETASAATVAADLLAQAEHDDDALPVLVALDEGLVGRVDAELMTQLMNLPTAATARNALRNGFVVVAESVAEAIDLCDHIAPEHLQLCVRDPHAMAERLRHYGSLFIGENAAEVFGDYGAGPNHVLPTGGTARYTGGLSVFDFLKIQTRLEVTDLAALRPMATDAVRLARMEGLEAHARAVERRLAVRHARSA